VPSGGHLIDHCPETEQVCSYIQFFSTGLFRRHIRDRTHCRTRTSSDEGWPGEIHAGLPGPTRRAGLPKLVVELLNASLPVESSAKGPGVYMRCLIRRAAIGHTVRLGIGVVSEGGKAVIAGSMESGESRD